jgi:gentisate 1,2-dioxygenase
MGSIPQESTEDGLGQLFSELPSHHLEPLWLKMDAMVPTSPNPVAKPYLWKYQDALPNLLRAGKLVPAESAERRVLMLVNPSMSEFATLVPSPHVREPTIS